MQLLLVMGRGLSLAMTSKRRYGQVGKLFWVDSSVQPRGFKHAGGGRGALISHLQTIQQPATSPLGGVKGWFLSSPHLGTAGALGAYPCRSEGVAGVCIVLKRF